ncbi:MAG TPA: carboxypeptidase regulatory-like domain-containing protein, partial [Polyangiaceae bacterium]
MKLTYAVLGIFGILLVTVLLAAGCGSDKNGSGFDDGTNGGDGGASTGDAGKGFGGGDGDGAAPPALNCSNSGTVTGTVYAPNGTLPLYNVIVYTPSSALAPFTEGVSCDKCGTVSGNPLASTVTDATGKFTLQVPPGDNVPLVMQVGKWRRQVAIPHVDVGCSTPLALTDANLTRLPKNHTEGDIPHIAVTTGGCDGIACVLPKMGIDAAEFGNQSEYSSKRVIMYQGSGPAAVSGITKANNLWGVPAELAKYDVAIFSCECDEHNETKPA